MTTFADRHEIWLELTATADSLADALTNRDAVRRQQMIDAIRNMLAELEAS